MNKVFFTALGTSVLAILLVSGCANLSIKTNAGEVALDSVKVGKVDTYTLEELSRLRAQFIGDVTTSYCENSLDPAKLDYLPSLSSMEKTLKLQVLQRGGNGIVVKQCGRVADLSCNVYIECNGEAYSVNRDF
ncbi:MAG: hypothetical protein WBG74_09590 [Shewanella sp.]|uniref:hypothetical protein n=1 Tax=Shewanella sp. TaxID=50422 RepID=UPI003C76322B